MAITPDASRQPAPELDLVTQLQLLASALPQGISAFDHLFAEVGRINQYDPVQDYLTQAHLAAAYRLREKPNNAQLAYTLALADILQRQAKPAIAALEKVIQLDFHNPWPYAYLAFVHLYNFSPAPAQEALQFALSLRPEQPEFILLGGVADLMQGKMFSGWQAVQRYLKSSSDSSHPKT
jgi:predicted Zn-dependent protease